MDFGEYSKGKNFAAGSGLPEGDTYIKIEKLQVEEEEFEGKMRWKLEGEMSKDNKEFSKANYFVPKTVMGLLQGLSESEAKIVRVTRTGLKLNDTSYTAVKVE